MVLQKQPPEVLYKKKVSQSLFKLIFWLQFDTLLKKRLWYRCFHVNFVRFLRTPFLCNTSRWLLLNIVNFILPQVQVKIRIGYSRFQTAVHLPLGYKTWQKKINIFYATFEFFVWTQFFWQYIFIFFFTDDGEILLWFEWLWHRFTSILQSAAASRELRLRKL